MRRYLKSVFALTALSFAQVAIPATSTSTFTVTATVASSCTLGTSNVAFGAYNPTSGTANDASGAALVTCTTGTTYTIALDAGVSAGGASVFSNRRMRIGATTSYLGYQLYLDSGRVTVWGDGLNSSSINPTSGTSTGNGSQQSYTVYGRITAGNYVTAGSYTDTVTVTLTYT
ncbi:spore coat U domain-containing protein [Aquabacterium sp.]|uniref:Csu type fimbrial protein n=1 Tax=Aquabacterium sp. TaxID=1872578 RepID=UPI00199FDC30|nr:spore coat U domain-containing protein [Aquabacterium sp.]MBC7700636.1 spore coat protein U domain-containing protein [Aquabacterium sp.]